MIVESVFEILVPSKRCFYSTSVSILLFYNHPEDPHPYLRLLKMFVSLQAFSKEEWIASSTIIPTAIYKLEKTKVR